MFVNLYFLLHKRKLENTRNTLFFTKSKVTSLKVTSLKVTSLEATWGSDPRKVKQLQKLRYHMFSGKCTKIHVSSFEPRIREKIKQLLKLRSVSECLQKSVVHTDVTEGRSTKINFINLRVRCGYTHCPRFIMTLQLEHL